MTDFEMQTPLPAPVEETEQRWPLALTSCKLGVPPRAWRRQLTALREGRAGAEPGGSGVGAEGAGPDVYPEIALAPSKLPGLDGRKLLLRFARETEAEARSPSKSSQQRCAQTLPPTYTSTRGPGAPGVQAAFNEKPLVSSGSHPHSDTHRPTQLHDGAT